MVTVSSNLSLSDVLFGKTRQAILSLLFMRPDETFHLRHLVRLTQIGVGAAQRELAALTSVGLVLRAQRGNQVLYRVNRDSPVYSEMRDLVIKTMGVADRVRLALSGVRPSVRFAIAFGSIVRGQQHAGSDLDLIIVADELSFDDLVAALKPVEAGLGREVNPILYTSAEFASKILEGHTFLRRVLTGARLVAIGDEHELAGLAQKRLAPQTPVARRAGVARTPRRGRSRLA